MTGRKNLGSYWIVILLSLMGVGVGSSEENRPGLDGIYTESRTFIDKDGHEVEGFMHDYAVLELRADRFNYWHFSDAIGRRIYPIKGTYSRVGDLLELESEKLMPTEKRWLVKTVKGVDGIWPEQELEKWEKGEYPISVPVLLKVASGPVGKKGLRQDLFKFPSVSPLLNKKSAEEYWGEQEAKHIKRFEEVPEPLRALLRARTNGNDGDLLEYRNLILDQQEKPELNLMNQLVGEIGKGVSIVVGPRVLEDIYGPSILLPDKPAFEKTRESKWQALRVLVASMAEARNDHALQATLMLFLRTSGIEEMDYKCENGVRVKLSWKGNRKKMTLFDFNESVRDECQKWAEAQLAAIFEKEA